MREIPLAVMAVSACFALWCSAVQCTRCWMKPGWLLYCTRSTGEESRGVVVGPSPKGIDDLAIQYERDGKTVFCCRCQPSACVPPFSASSPLRVHDAWTMHSGLCPISILKVLHNKGPWRDSTYLEKAHFGAETKMGQKAHKREAFSKAFRANLGCQQPVMKTQL